MITNQNINDTINFFGDYIRNSAKKIFNCLVTKGAIDTYQTFQDEVWELTSSILGADAYGDQIAYLRRTTKPNNWAFAEG